MDWNENHSRTGTDLTDLNKAEKVGIRLIRKGGGGRSQSGLESGTGHAWGQKTTTGLTDKTPASQFQQ